MRACELPAPGGFSGHRQTGVDGQRGVPSARTRAGRPGVRRAGRCGIGRWIAAGQLVLLPMLALAVLPSGALATGWTIQTTPAVAGLSDGMLSAVSCAARTSCVAVGSDNDVSGEPTGAFAESWSGTTWTSQATAAPRRGTPNLSAVSCASAAFCVAVGATEANQSEAPLTESWNGTTWSVLSTPSPARGGSLSGVSCRSRTFCIAVGGDRAGGTLAERWNGTIWSIQATPRLPFPHTGTLAAVSCTAADACTAVGYFQAPETCCAAPGALAERWNGVRWAMQRANLPENNRTGTLADFDAALAGVSCISRSSCIAVGASFPEEGNGYPGKPLAERWNGTGWANMPSAVVPRAGGQLNGVSCVSSSACTAVGQLNPGAYPKFRLHFGTSLLAEHWTGTRWAVQPSERAPGSAREFGPPDFLAVACVAPAICVAVGNRDAGQNATLPLAEGYGWPAPGGIAVS